MEERVTDFEFAIVKLDAFFAHPDPGFICADPFGDPAARYVARVRHEPGGEAEGEDLLWLRNELGPLYKPFVYPYFLHDGWQLFIPKIARGDSVHDGGLIIFPLEMVRQSREVIREHYSDCRMIDGRPPTDDLIAFATVPLSGNLICIGTAGAHRGELVELNHDAPPGGFGIPKKVADLLTLVRAGPGFFFYMAGGYTFYSDGKTHAQWRAVRYVADCSSLTQGEIASEPLPDWFPE
jgi:hypothetical protein